jgi:hypothetical protein
VLLDNYYSSILRQLESEIVYNFINPIGKDITDIIRGKIFMVREFITLKDRIEQQVTKGAN